MPAYSFSRNQSINSIGLCQCSYNFLQFIQLWVRLNPGGFAFIHFDKGFQRGHPVNLRHCTCYRWKKGLKQIGQTRNANRKWLKVKTSTSTTQEKKGQWSDCISKNKNKTCRTCFHCTFSQKQKLFIALLILSIWQSQFPQIITPLLIPAKQLFAILCDIFSPPLNIVFAVWKVLPLNTINLEAIQLRNDFPFSFPGLYNCFRVHFKEKKNYWIAFKVNEKQRHDFTDLQQKKQTNKNL